MQRNSQNVPNPKWSRVKVTLENQPNTSVYASTHNTVIHMSTPTPKWLIVKTELGWVVYSFIHGRHIRLTGLQPMKTLKDAKYYCDVEVENFNRGMY